MRTKPANAFLEAATVIDERLRERTSSIVLDLDEDPESLVDVADQESLFEVTEGEMTHDGSQDGAHGTTFPDATEREPFLEAATVIELIETLEPCSGPPPVPPARRFIETATIQERLDDEDGLVRRLEHDPDDPVAGEALEALYARRGDQAAVVAHLLDRAEAAEDPTQRVALMVRAARTYRLHLSDLDAARLVLLTALGLAPGEQPIHVELDAVAAAGGKYVEIRAAYAAAAFAVEAGERAPGRSPAADRALAGLLWLKVASLHLMERDSPASASAALARVAAVPPGRVEALLAVCERLADDLGVLDALIALHRRLGDRAGAARVLALSIDHATDAADRARRHHEIAEAAAERSDELEAEWHLAEALRLAPARAQTRAALAELYRRRREPRRAARLLEDASGIEHNPVDRANLACLAASIYANELGEGSRAIDLYGRVLLDDPERPEAAAPLAERYWQRQRFAELEPLIEVLARRATAAGEPDEIAEQCYRAGRTALELGRAERALAHLRASLRCAPGRIEALRAFVAAAAALGRHAEARDALARVHEIQEAAGARTIDRADTLAELGDLTDKAGSGTSAVAAIDHYLAALRLVRAHERALPAAVAWLRQRGDHQGVADLLAAAARTVSGERRVRLLAELAALHAHDLAAPALALELYRQALAVIPDDRAVLTALAELYTAAESWREAVDTLTRLAALEPVGPRRGRFLQIAAQLSRGRLPDQETATLFAEAVECFFGEGVPLAGQRKQALRAFAELEKLLRDRRAWKALERAYRIMIKRMGADAPELAELWARLGALYRDLDQPMAALESCEVAASLAGDRATCQRVLVDLYGGFAPPEIESLIDRRRHLLEADPLVGEHYRVLASLHRRLGRRDQAFLMQRALAAVGAANQDELDGVLRQEATRRPWPNGPLDRGHRARLRHPDEDARVSSILALCTEVIAGELAVSPERLPIKDDPSAAWYPLRALHNTVAGLVSVPPPRLFVCPKLDVELVFANIQIDGQLVLGLVAGRKMISASLAQAKHAFAWALAHVRPAYILRLLLARPGALESAVDAALMVGGYGGFMTPSGEAHQLATALAARMSPAYRQHLTTLVAPIRESREELEEIVQGWAEAVDATCRRTALLLAGDLPTAVAALGRELPHAARRPYQLRLADLLLHSVSDDHVALRAALGLAVG